MKKIPIIMLAVITAVLLFAVSANAAATVKQCNYDAGTTTGEDYYFRGWVVVEGDTVVDMGYRLDDKDPVFSVADNRPDVAEYFKIDPSVVGGFDFHLKPGDLDEGEHIIHVVVKTSDGSVLDVNNATDDGYTLLGTKKVEEPVVSDDPAGTDEPVQTEEPAGTDEPVQTEEPAETDGPVQTEEPAGTDGPAQPDNPGTADASVIAVAVVACVALAGVVAARKTK